MKKRSMFALLLVIILTISIIASGCSKKEDDTKEYADGIYFAMEDDFNETTGWKSTVTIEVKDGKIVMADWNAANKNGGEDKKTQSKNGTYAMVEKGGSQSEWHEQAEKVEAYLIKEQDPASIKYSDDEGHTDAISGVSVHVNDFFTLADKALKAGVKGYGMYKDGTYHAEDEAFAESGWKEVIDATVISGYIAAVNWNPLNKEGADKKTQSKDGTYGMKEKGGAQAEWHEQAMKLENDIVKTQDIEGYKASDDEGSIDSVAGVSIHAMPVIELLKDALTKR